MLFLDTHVAVWLFARPDLLPAHVQTLLDNSELFISPIARLELSLLYEVGRLTVPASAVLTALERDIGLQVEESGWLRAARIADDLSWTRDPFDRLITAHAMAFAAMLCTRDETIRARYSQAYWES